MSSLIQTARLDLRLLQVGDLEAMCTVFGDTDVMRFGDGVQTKAWVSDWIDKVLKHDYVEWGYGPYAVVAREAQEVLGYCGLFYFPDINGRQEVEIGFRLAKKHWGAGYATEAGAGVRDYAFTTLEIRRLIALIDPGNAASARVAKKLGMTKESEVLLSGYTHPDDVYAIERLDS